MHVQKDCIDSFFCSREEGAAETNGRTVDASDRRTIEGVACEERVFAGICDRTHAPESFTV